MQELNLRDRGGAGIAGWHGEEEIGTGSKGVEDTGTSRTIKLGLELGGWD